MIQLIAAIIVGVALGVLLFGITMFNAALFVMAAAFWGYTLSMPIALIVGACCAVGTMAKLGSRE